MNEELKEAFKLIKNECDKHKNCVDCPFNEGNPISSYCDQFFYKLPCEWKLN